MGERGKKRKCWGYQGDDVGVCSSKGKSVIVSTSVPYGATRLGKIQRTFHRMVGIECLTGKISGMRSVQVGSRRCFGRWLKETTDNVTNLTYNIVTNRCTMCRKSIRVYCQR